METVVKHLQNALTASTASALKNSTDNKPEDRLNELLLERFFRAMQIEFGARWSSQFPTPESLADAKMEWGKKLAGLSGAQIRAGLDAMDVGQTAWPLGPRGFVKLARDAYHPPYRPNPELLELQKPKVVDPEQQARIKLIIADCLNSFKRDVPGDQVDYETREKTNDEWSEEEQ